MIEGKSKWFGLRNARKECGCTPLAWIVRFIPILDWLPKYNWKEDLTKDLIAGFTVAVMQIPQGFKTC